MCPYYQAIEVYVAPSERRHRTMAVADPTRQVVWCAHANSPSMRHVALRVPNSHAMLPCGGDVDKCLVPLDKR